MDRKLAHIEKIEDIQPIPNADSIVVATVLGWKCVVKKDEFKVGDSVVYVEVDSIMPEKPEYEFLRERKFRVRTIKLRGQISQGLVLPLSVLLTNKKYKIGQDVTDILDIVKYESPTEKEESESPRKSKNPFIRFMSRYKWFRKLFLPKKVSGNFPNWIRKTDEERLQNLPWVFEQYKEVPFVFTEKLDGQSATYFLKRNGKNFEFGVCSRNFRRTHEDNSSFWKIAKQYDIQNFLMSIIGENEYIVLQGEIIGEGIQGNKYGISGYEFFSFNLLFPDRQCKYLEMVDFLEDNIDCVPFISYRPLLDTIEKEIQLSNNKSILNPKILREGLVVRSDDTSQPISFKIINPEFLLKHKE